MRPPPPDVIKGKTSNHQPCCADSLHKNQPQRQLGHEGYQLALTTPGILPDMANSRKQMRQSWNLRIYPRGRPHRLHRLRTRTSYLRRVSLAMILFLATYFLPLNHHNPS